MYEVVRRVMVPFRKIRIPGTRNRYFDLTQPQFLANKLFASVRGRVEHVNAYVVSGLRYPCHTSQKQASTLKPNGPRIGES